MPIRRISMHVNKIAAAKLFIFLSCLAPFLFLIWKGLVGRLGANPVETITHTTGDWALYFLLITLSISPLRDITGKALLFRFRRMLGLYVFFYALLHFLTWLIFDHYFDWYEIQKDILKRPYVTVGFTAFVLLIPLTITSTFGMRRRLGQRWKQLHQLIYVIAVLATLHYLWLVKADTREPIMYGVVLILLLIHRAWKQRMTRKKHEGTHEKVHQRDYSS